MKPDMAKAKWIAWLLFSLGLAGWLSYIMVNETTDKTVFMPGELSPGHHQLADDCAACHTDAFGGGEVLQSACVECHGEQRVKPFDSHPKKKFKDPRNAELLNKINALECVTCHSEHRPEITARDGLTQPRDFCVHCHEEVGKNRESHRGMAFDSCKDSGCHNFHDNRALYTKFLIKHLDEPPMLERMVVKQREFAQVLDEVAGYPHDKYPVRELGEDDIDANQSVEVDEIVKTQWLETAHARSGVNCSACHRSKIENQQGNLPSSWDDHPDHAACADCHDVESRRFMQGKHGMRLKQGLSPMTPAAALLTMKEKASHDGLTCNSCHPVHSFETKGASVDVCLGCHDDRHSLAYEASPHAELWKKELAGEAEPGSGVSCATCHMPRINYDVSEWSSRIVVDHNQSANLSPNSKMLRTTCLDCHGMEFAIDALADRSLITTNFKGRPSIHVQSLDLARQDEEKRKQKASDSDTGMFGF